MCPAKVARLKDYDLARKRRKREGEATEEAYENEVHVIRGYCVTWRCQNPAPDGPECAEHATEELPPMLTHNERVKLRRLNDSEWRDREARRKRDVRTAKRVAAGFDPDVPTQTAIKERRYEMILERLRSDGSIVTSDFARELGKRSERVSEDLQVLAERGLVVRYRGGARLALESTSNLG